MERNRDSLIKPISENVHVEVIENKNKEVPLIRVAAYCRVSTNLEIQQSSLEAQIYTYQKVICDHPGWILAGVYADKGISGTSTKHREQFKRMVKDAQKGKIDYIIAKSISRFARNTVDALAYVRMLKSYGVSVYFEKEKLDTGDMISEFLLSIFAAAAQEEIISLSNNMKIGRRMRYAAGIEQWQHIYGFRKTPENNWVVEEDEASIVRSIFEDYVNGFSLPKICKRLENEGIKTAGGKRRWYPKQLASILHNEKYAGDIRMQKSYVSDPIQHTQISNRDARLKQYYVENHHPAIVNKDVFRMAQMMLAMKDMHRGASQYPYYGFLRCGICGEKMIRFCLPRRTNLYAWTCGGKTDTAGQLRKQRSKCPPYYFLDKYIDEGLWEALREVECQLANGSIGEENNGSVLAKQMLNWIGKRKKKKHQLEYRDLCSYINEITFPDWATMRISWKVGLTTDTHINYVKASDHPFPLIERKEIIRCRASGKPVKAKVYTVNGLPLIKGCPDRQIISIRRAQSEIQELLILEPRIYEPDIPRVFGKRTTCNNPSKEQSKPWINIRQRKEDIII